MGTQPEGLRELSLFSGAGGGLLATQHLLGWRAVCYVERDPYCQRVLKQRMADGLLHDAPIWDDCRTFDGKPWRGLVDVISAGFPCQPFSVAGARKADADERNGWPWVARLVREVGPRYVFLENVCGLLASSHGYFGTVLGDLAESGYDARWTCLSASDCGAPHLRKRLWVRACLRVPDASGDGVRVKRERDGGQRGKPRPPVSGDDGEEEQLADAAIVQRNGSEDNKERSGQCERQIPQSRNSARHARPGGDWWGLEPDVGRVANGVAARVDRLRALGNGQVPAVAAAAWRLLNQSEKEAEYNERT